MNIEYMSAIETLQGLFEKANVELNVNEIKEFLFGNPNITSISLKNGGVIYHDTLSTRESFLMDIVICTEHQDMFDDGTIETIKLTLVRNKFGRVGDTLGYFVKLNKSNMIL